MRHCIRHIVAATLTVALLILLATAALAAYQQFSHATPYNGSNNWPPNETPPGYLHSESFSTDHYWASGEQIQWTPGAVTWIQNSRGIFGQNQVALVFHAFLADTENCSNVFIESAWSDLPGYWNYLKSTCGGPNNEIRLFAGDPLGLVPNISYSAVATYVDLDPPNYRRNEVNIDNYFVDTSIQQPLYRDHMQKFCYYNQWIYEPNGDGQCNY